MMPKEPHAPSAPSALDERTDELLEENLELRKAAPADGQKVPEVREAVKQDFKTQTPADKFTLLQELEKERKAKKETPAMNSSMK